MRDRAGAGTGDRDPLHQGGPRPGRQAGGWQGDGADHCSDHKHWDSCAGPRRPHAPAPTFSRGFRVQGKTSDSAMKVLEDALAVQEAGCFAVVLEAVPPEVAALITEKLSIPTIGIGAGSGCSGQGLGRS